MSGASIAAEVSAALREVARDVGSGTFAVTLVRPTESPSTPWDTGNYGEPDEYELAAMVQDYPRALIDGTLIMQDDRRVMVEASGTVPLTTDRLVIGSDTYTIISVREIAPSGVALYYEVQARK